METRNNYKIQMQQAKALFLTYDQEKIIRKCRLQQDDRYLYFTFLGEKHRICRKTGGMQRLHRDVWLSADEFDEVMTVLDWLCDSREDRYITGRWVNMVTLGHGFHRALQEEKEDPDALRFDADPQGFCKACQVLGGEAMEQGDISYAIELMDGLKILVCLWHGDEEFAPRLRLLWDENTHRYIRYETTWYAAGLLMRRLVENMK